MVDPGSLAGRTALVTGASSGLGAHFARVLAGAGANVVLAARRREALSALAAEIGEQASTVVLDVTDPASIAEAEAHLPSLDILVNNAGVVRDGYALDQTDADWDVVIDTNLKGVFQVAQAVARNMIAGGRGGSIVNIASVLGLRQGAAVSPYAVSKAGVVQMTKVLALEWARHGIRVNALAPGYFDTDLNSDFWQTDAGRAMLKRIPQRRLGQLADLDAPLLLLAGPGSAYMSGSVLAVDGGHLVSSL